MVLAKQQARGREEGKVYVLSQSQGPISTGGLEKLVGRIKLQASCQSQGNSSGIDGCEEK